MTYGVDEGETCGRDGCTGKIEVKPVENCSCHINPPCSACTSPRGECPECGWDEAEDPVDVPVVGVYHGWHSPAFDKPLDASKISWRSKPHSSCSMLIEGVYPDGTTSTEVADLVRGTFGGAFRQFGGGKFVYIAYTD